MGGLRVHGNSACPKSAHENSCFVIIDKIISVFRYQQSSLCRTIRQPIKSRHLLVVADSFLDLSHTPHAHRLGQPAGGVFQTNQIFQIFRIMLFLRIFNLSICPLSLKNRKTENQAHTHDMVKSKKYQSFEAICSDYWAVFMYITWCF